jgi:acetyl esterase
MIDFDQLREARFAKLSPEKRKWFAEAPGSGLREAGVENVRAFLAKTRESKPSLPAGVRTVDALAAGPSGPVPVRLFIPSARRTLGVHFHVHAGGYFMLGGLDAEVTELGNMAIDLGCIVVTSDFRLPPEHKFPIGLDDVWAALQWTVDNVAKHGGDPARIGIGGGCTGGVFAAVTALTARDQGLKLRYLLMRATVTDARERYRSYLEFANGYTLTTDSANFVTNLYLRDDLDRFDWRASPILVPSVNGLPPTMVIEGEWDVLHDEAEAWANRLRDAGVDVQFVVFEEEGHQLSPASMRKAQETGYDFIRRHLA